MASPITASRGTSQGVSLTDLPAELVLIIVELLGNVRDVGSLRLVCRNLVPSAYLWKTYHVMPTSASLKQLWTIGTTLHSLISDDAVRKSNPDYIQVVVFENVWPIPPDEFGLSIETGDESIEPEVDKVVRCPEYLRYIDKRHAERENPATGRLLSTCMNRLNHLEEMIFSPGLHESRPPPPIPALPIREFRYNASLYIPDRIKFPESIWNYRELMWEPLRGINTSGAKLFDEAIDGALRNPYRKKALKVRINTLHRRALWSIPEACRPIPESQLGRSLHITYSGYNMWHPSSMKLDLRALHSQRLGTGSHYAAVEDLSFSGAELGNSGALHMGYLGWPNMSPDWSRVKNLRLNNCCFSRQSAIFLEAQKSHLELHNAYWHSNSIQGFWSGTNLQSVKVSGVFVIEGVGNYSNGVWILAQCQIDAQKIAAENWEPCTQLIPGPLVLFVLPDDVERYVMFGGAFPFPNNKMWARDWKV